MSTTPGDPVTLNFDDATDLALFVAFTKGEAEASTLFVRRHHRAVYALAHSMVRDAGIAADIAQDVFLRAWRAADSYDPSRGKVLTWLLRITRNCAIDILRASGDQVIDDAALEPLVNASHRTDVSQEESAAERLVARDAIEDLHRTAPEQARAVVLSVIGGWRAQDIADHDGIPVGTVKTRIRSGLRRLRKVMSDDR